MKHSRHDTMRPWVAAVVRLLLGVVLALNAALRSARGLVRSARGLGETVRGRPPPPPRVLGVVVAGQRKSLGEDELRATARVINWAVANGLTLLTLYSPHDLFDVMSIEREIRRMGADDDVTVWSGWRAPGAWIEGALGCQAQQAHQTRQAHRRQPLGVALLSPADAEGPLTMLQGAPASNSASGEGSSLLTSLQRALRAPEELRRAMGCVGGRVAQLDPDIIMIFGGVSSLFGYPSWLTRSSEIYSMGDLASVGTDALSESLDRYMMTKKRGGR
mmetsp:Transcript_9299/g.25115  ORF Transcript_9299/g.25115 Transcript_9299/m.25115 type:complete len:275 (+) Transcript_9299:114-938(+)